MSTSPSVYKWFVMFMNVTYIFHLADGPVVGNSGSPMPNDPFGLPPQTPLPSVPNMGPTQRMPMPNVVRSQVNLFKCFP